MLQNDLDIRRSKISRVNFFKIYPMFVSSAVCSRNVNPINPPLGYERVYLSLGKVADTPFYIQGDEVCATAK